MKKYVLIPIVAIMFSCNSTKTVAESPAPPTDTITTTTPATGIPPAHNKKFIQEYFDETYLLIVNATNGLSYEQLNFKSSPEKWSIMECLEHIVVTEPQLFEYEKDVLSKPATPEKRNDIKLTDDDIMVMIVDRSFKAKAPAEMAPQGKYKDVQTALNDLQKQRKEMMVHLEDYTMDDLRNRVLEGPFGSIDAYQFMLFIPGHTARHTMQIQEVKQDSNFPKN